MVRYWSRWTRPGRSGDEADVALAIDLAFYAPGRLRRSKFKSVGLVNSPSQFFAGRSLHCGPVVPPAATQGSASGAASEIAAIYVALAPANIVPMRPTPFLLTLRAIAMLACLAEVPFGRYRKSA
jgi:hypothetical protein